MNLKNIKFRLYGLFANMFLIVSVLLLSKDISAKETIDIESMIVAIFAIGLLYYLHKRLGTKVAHMTARFILDIYPEYMMKNENEMTKKVQQDLEVLNSTDSLFEHERYNLYAVSSVFVFNAIGAIFENYSQAFVYFLIVDIFLLMIVVVWSCYFSFKVFQQYKNIL